MVNSALLSGSAAKVACRGMQKVRPIGISNQHPETGSQCAAFNVVASGSGSGDPGGLKLNDSGYANYYELRSSAKQVLSSTGGKLSCT